MLDINFIKENKERVEKALLAKNVSFDLNAFLDLDVKRRKIIQETESLRAEQNSANKEIKVLLKEKKDASSAISAMKKLAASLGEKEKELKDIKDEFNSKLLSIPNVFHSSIPDGDITCNKIVKEWGKIPKFSFKPLTHIDISDNLGLIDFKRGAKITGSNFVLYTDKGARLVRALMNFMLDLHTKEHGYTEIFPPFLANRDSMTGTGQLPKLEEDMYRLNDEDFFLIPTAEVPVTNIHRNDIFNEDDLPVLYTAYSACFRREAGSYGKDTKGLMRLHQFNKVELVKFVKPQNSYDELDKLLNNACKVIELLEIPYRVVMLASGDLSFAAAKCFDIEIYSPGMDKWLEVSSCSNFEDFQARRSNIKYRDKQTNKLHFVHTLNGSGVAFPRLITAILECFQTEEKEVVVPKALRSYYDGKNRI